MTKGQVISVWTRLQFIEPLKENQLRKEKSICSQPGMCLDIVKNLPNEQRANRHRYCLRSEISLTVGKWCFSWPRFQAVGHSYLCALFSILFLVSLHSNRSPISYTVLVVSPSTLPQVFSSPLFLRPLFLLALFYTQAPFCFTVHVCFCFLHRSSHSQALKEQCLKCTGLEDIPVPGDVENRVLCYN